MTTTNLFVELLVIGVGATTWIVLLILGIFGYSWIPLGVKWITAPHIFLLAILIPVISITYLLGIITDRIADALFEKLWAKNLRHEWFFSDAEYHNTRRSILLHAPQVYHLLQYSKSRLRICRGWSLNAILTIVPLYIFLWKNFPVAKTVTYATIFGSFFLIFIAFGSWFSWKQLSKNQYIKILEQGKFLKAEKIDKESNFPF